jgi:hypothetical protein
VGLSDLQRHSPRSPARSSLLCRPFPSCDRRNVTSSSEESSRDLLHPSPSRDVKRGRRHVFVRALLRASCRHVKLAAPKFVAPCCALRALCGATILLLGALHPASRPTAAAIVEISVGGRIQVTDALGLLPTSVKTGESWSGLIRYDTGLVDLDPDPQRGRYGAPQDLEGLSISVNVSGHIFSGGFGELTADVLDNVTPPAAPAISFPAGDTFSIGGPMRTSPYLLDFPTISFAWNDASGMAFHGDSLPTNLNPLSLKQVDSAGDISQLAPIYIRISDLGLTTPTHAIRYSVLAAIESAQVRIVPESATRDLVVIGLLAIAISSSQCRRSVRMH